MKKLQAMNQVIELPSVGNFMDRALGFTKNPLGIIGLFIALIYGFAVLVAGFSAELSDMQRWVMIALVAVFPLAVLWTFFLLVTKHHTKLYAPGDWKDEQNFLIAMSGKEQLEQVRAEAREVLTTEAKEGNEAKAAAPMATADRQLLVSQIRDAESLALDALEKRFGMTIMRGVRMAGPGASDIIADGFGYDPVERRVTLFEVKLLRSPSSITRVISGVVKTGERAVQAVAANLPWSESVSLCLVIVTAGISKADQRTLADVAEERLTTVLPNSSIVLFDLDEIREEVDPLGP